MSDELTIDGFGPLPVRRPASVADVGETVRECVAAGRGLYPVGGRTQLHLGFVPSKPGIAVDLTGLNKVIDYPARDMTVTVQAGVTIGDLQRLLSTENQWLPIDVPDADRATVGGSIATNISGPRRLSQGTFRDYLLGVKFVSDEEVEVRAGGRVVKNVAGYDLMKLHTGALGTLGVLTEVTLKVKPRPEARAAVTFEMNPTDLHFAGGLGGLLDRLHASKSRPAAVELIWHPVGRPGWWVVAGFEEKADTVRWQVETLTAELAGAAVSNVVPAFGAEAATAWQRITDSELPVGAVVVRAVVPPSRVGEMVSAIRDAKCVTAHALSGVVTAGAFTHADDPGVLEWVNAIETKAHALGGFATVRRVAPELKAKLPVWGRPRGDTALMKHLKQTLDPADVFNPGRLIGNRVAAGNV